MARHHRTRKYIRIETERVEGEQNLYRAYIIDSIGNRISPDNFMLCTHSELDKYSFAWANLMQEASDSSELFERGDIVRPVVVRGRCPYPGNVQYQVHWNEDEATRTIHIHPYDPVQDIANATGKPIIAPSVFFELVRKRQDYTVYYNAQVKAWGVIKTDIATSNKVVCSLFSCLMYPDAKQRAEDEAAFLNKKRTTPIIADHTDIVVEGTSKYIVTPERKHEIMQVPVKYNDIESLQARLDVMYPGKYKALEIIINPDKMANTNKVKLQCLRCGDIFEIGIKHILLTRFANVERCMYCATATFEIGASSIIQKVDDNDPYQLKLLQDIENYQVTDKESFIRRAEYIYGTDHYDFNDIVFRPSDNGYTRVAIRCKRTNRVFSVQASRLLDIRNKYPHVSHGLARRMACKFCEQPINTTDNLIEVNEQPANN